MSWSVGDTVVVQEIWHERVWAARPMRVVRNQAPLALWFPSGTRWQAPTTPAGEPSADHRGERLARCLAARAWDFVEYQWDVDTLCLLRPDRWHAIWVSWLPSGEQWGWYVNLQEPYRATRCGIATFDLALDLIIDVDGSWRWKDEDELQAYVEHGVLDTQLAERLYAEGRTALEQHSRRESDFASDWPAWRPDRSWPVPRLPDGWDVPCL